MYLPIFGGERYMFAIQKRESERVGWIWLEGYVPAPGGGGGGGGWAGRVIWDSKIVMRWLQSNIWYIIL